MAMITLTDKQAEDLARLTFQIIQEAHGQGRKIRIQNLAGRAHLIIRKAQRKQQ